MRKLKQLAGILMVIFAVMAVITGCGGSGNSDTLNVAQGADAKTLDPHGTNDQPSSRVMTQIYDTLVVQMKDGTIEPGLAKSWEQTTDTRWEFKLEEGVKFHNGEELKASDVKFTIARALESPEVAHILGEIESVEVVDDYTVALNLKNAFAPILSHLSHNAASIVNEKAVTESGEDYGQNPVGTGPYKLSAWQAGDSIELVAHEDYFKGAPETKNIKFRSIPEGTNRTIALETGEVDIAYDIDPIDKSKVKEHEDLMLLEEPSLSIQYIGFNMNKEPFDKIEVRKAINYAIDREAIVDAVLMGAGEVGTSPLAPNVAMSNQDVEAYEFDLEKAKELMKEAGMEDGFEATIWVNDNKIRIDIAQIVQASLKEIGIKLEIETLEWGSYLDRTAAGEHDMYILGWTAVTGDPDYGLYALFHSSDDASAGNRSFYSNPKVDDLLDKGKIESDFDKRKEYYYEAQEIIVDETPVANLYYASQTAGVNKSVSGFELHHAGSHVLYGVTKK